MNFIEKTKRLPVRVKEYLSSDEIRLDLEKSMFLYDIPENMVQNISGQVGLVFVKDFRLSDLPKEIFQKCGVSQDVAYGIAYEINNRIFMRFPEYFTDAQNLLSQWKSLKALPFVSEATAKERVMEIESWLFEVEKEEMDKMRREEEKIRSFVQFSLLKALEKYPRINEQQVTSERIRVKSERDAVRGTVRNWLRAYRDVLGVRAHTAMERGQFLFQSENAKKLSQREREKVSVLLKSLDENAVLSIDPARQEIVFPEFVAAARPTATVAAQPAVSQSPVPSASSVAQSSSASAPQPKPAFRETAPATHNFAAMSRQDERTQDPVPPKESSFRPQQTVVPKPASASSEPNSQKTNAAFSFSSGQMLPSEKEALERMRNRPMPKNKPVFGLDYAVNPLKPAVPSSQPKEVRHLPNDMKNVVDLRSEE